LLPHSIEPATVPFSNAQNSSTQYILIISNAFFKLLLLFFHALAQTLWHTFISYRQVASTISAARVLTKTPQTRSSIAFVKVISKF